MATQMAKTLVSICMIGQKTDEDPMPILYICPTKKLAESVSRDRFTKLIMYCKAIKEKMSFGGCLDNITEKHIAGTTIRFMWAGSATELASHPAALVIVDERDRMADNIAGEGDPVRLAEARTAAYSDALIIIFTTPTIEDVSPGEKLWRSGTRKRYYWPCLGCGVYFAPFFKHHKWPEGTKKEDLAIRELRKGEETNKVQSWIECPNCKHKHFNEDKEFLNENGLYLGPKQTAKVVDGVVEIQGDLADVDNDSFWVSGLCSPFDSRSFNRLAYAWLEAVESGNPEEIKTVLNTMYGECFRVKGLALNNNLLDNIAVSTPKLGHVHDDAVMLTAGADVQQDCIYYVVRAWLDDESSYIVEHGKLYGNPVNSHVWDKLQVVLDREYFAESGKMYQVLRMGVDSGYASDMVYEFAKDNEGLVLATDGAESLVTPISARNIDIDYRGKQLKNGLQLWRFDKHFIRGWLFGRITCDEDSNGRWFISKDCDREYRRHLTAEKMVTLASGKQKWQKTRKNDYLDAEVNAVVAAKSVDVKYIAYLQDEERQQQATYERGSNG